MPVSQWLRRQGGQLPANVELITMQVMTSQPGSTLIRLAHLFGVGEDAALSQPVDVSLTALFAGMTVSNVVELSLSANQKRSEMPEMPALLIHGESPNVTATKRSLSPPTVNGNDITVRLNPAEIRTYSLTLA